MICIKKNLVFAAAMAATLAASSALATNGYFSHGYSLKEKGLAGAGVAYSQDTLAAAVNPAGMVWQGNRMDAGTVFFAPIREYTATGFNNPFLGQFGANPGAGGSGDTVNSDNELFIIPHFGWNKMLNANSSVGVSLYGNGGMNTEWQAKDTFGGGGVFANPAIPGSGGNGGVNLAQLFVTGTYARKISDTSSWGVSAIYAIQRFEAKGISAFAPLSVHPGNVNDRGNDISTGWGVKAGWQGKVTKNVTVGASYQSEIKMDEFDSYRGLFAENGGFDIPSTYTVGLAWNTTPNSILLVDWQRINYEDVPAISNPSLSRLRSSCVFAGGTGTAGCLGGSRGAGFGWNNMSIVKLGYQWKTVDNWTWRVGYSKGNQPISKDDVLFNVLAPGVMKEHFTFGFTKELDKTNEVTFSAMLAPEECVEGLSDPTSPGANQVTEICMRQFEVGASWAWKL